MCPTRWMCILSNYISHWHHHCPKSMVWRSHGILVLVLHNGRKSLHGLVEYVYHSRDLAAEFQNCKPHSLESLYLHINPNVPKNNSHILKYVSICRIIPQMFPSSKRRIFLRARETIKERKKKNKNKMNFYINSHIIWSNFIFLKKQNKSN